MDYSKIFYDSVIKSGKPTCLTATGFSMWPVIIEGMTAEITPLNTGLPKKASLLLVKRDSTLIVHRFWKTCYREGIPMVLTKGDTSPDFDQLVPLRMVIGQVTLLKHNVIGTRNPNQGWFYLYGRVLCSSTVLARIWAITCRLIIRLRNRLKQHSF